MSAWEMADEGILDGVYICMKRGDLTRPCRNQMVIRIANIACASWMGAMLLVIKAAAAQLIRNRALSVSS